MEAIFGELSIYIVLILCIVSFAAGFVDSVAGGGGLLMAPALLLSGMPPHLALGTNKFIAIFGTATAVINFTRHRIIIWRIAIIGLIASMIGAAIGTNAILLFDDKTATTIILAILPFTAIVTFMPKKQVKSNVSEFNNKELYLLVPIISFCLGFYDGFFGPGTGTFIIIAFYSVLGMNLIYASAVAKVINLASGVGSFITFAIAGKIFYTLGIPLIVCNIVGAYFGSKMAMSKGQSFIRKLIVIVFVMLFISLIIKYIG